MRYKHVVGMAVLVALAACSDQETPVHTAAPGAAPVLSAGQDAIHGSYIVVLKEGATPRSVAAVAGVSPRYVYSAVLNGFGATLNPGQLNALSHHPDVEYIQQNARITTTATQPSAPWGLDRIDQRNRPLSTTYTYTSTGAGVRVYIIDSGIRTSHTEFGGRASVLYDALGGTGQDCYGHGTHVAGIVGGSTYGVAKNVSLIAVRVTNCIGSGNSMAMIAGMDSAGIDASRHGGPAVANISLGRNADQAIDDAVDRMVARGVTVVVAAGNDNRSACLDSPARAPNAITVANSTITDARASTSNFGSCVDLFAPGTDIPSALSTSNTATATLSGTSMASPHVAGVAALYLEGNPTASPAAVANAILADATPGKVTSAGAGTPNRLLYVVPTATPVAVTITGPTSITAAGTYAWQANATGGNSTYTYQWEYRVQNGTWTPVGTGAATYSRTVATSDPSFELRVTVTSAGQIASDTHAVSVPRGTVSIAWVQPSGATWGPPSTLTVAGYASGGSGGVTIRWRDTRVGTWVDEPGVATVSDGTWSITLPSSNYCRDYEVQATYSGVVSAIFTYHGLTAGHCGGRVIWIQPQTTAGVGSPGSLVVAGEATGAPAGTPVVMWWRNVSTGGAWVRESYTPPTLENGIWINEIPNANYAQRYEVLVEYDVFSSNSCTYAGANAITWC